MYVCIVERYDLEDGNTSEASSSQSIAAAEHGRPGQDNVGAALTRRWRDSRDVAIGEQVECIGHDDFSSSVRCDCDVDELSVSEYGAHNE